MTLFTQDGKEGKLPKELRARARQLSKEARKLGKRIEEHLRMLRSNSYGKDAPAKS